MGGGLGGGPAAFAAPPGFVVADAVDGLEADAANLLAGRAVVTVATATGRTSLTGRPGKSSAGRVGAVAGLGLDRLDRGTGGW